MNKEFNHIKLNEKKWDKWSESLDGKGWRNEFLRKAQEGVVSLLEIKNDIHFLDVGCGTGWAIGKAAERFNFSGKFFGVDLSTKMIERAKENFQSMENFYFIKANAESIPLEDGFFDVIISTNSFHHYLNPGKALNEFYRLLKAGGKIYILDPTADSWLIKFLDKIIKMFEPEHVKMYSSKEFKDMFINAGFKYLKSVEVQTRQKIHIAGK